MKKPHPLATKLRAKHCKSCPDSAPALSAKQIQLLLPALPGWQSSGKEIFKTYAFENYYQTMAFVNALAYIAHTEDHHPDLSVGYNKCGVRYSSHEVGGISERDFICAAKVDALVSASPD